MQRHWSEVCPPMAVLLAGYVGWKPKARPKAELIDGDDLVNFLKAMG